MKLKYFLLPLALVLFSASAMAQTDVFGNRIPAKKPRVAPIPANYNQTDENGLKQGPWEKRYTDGSTLYTATFKDDKPVGKYTRYYPNRKKSLEINYDANGDFGNAKLYNEEGNLSSEGKYKGKVKVDTWTYFNDKGQKIATEDFVDGKEHGQYKVYYPDGKVAEIVNWVNGKKHGEWLKYFDNGAPLLISNYNNDKVDGSYLYYFKNGQLEIEANYTNDKEDGTWTFYHADGKVNYQLKYKNGTLLNPEVLDEMRAKEQADFERKKDSLQDPAKMKNNPDMYMR